MNKLWAQWKKINPPVRWLLYFITFLLSLSFLFAPEPQPVNWQQFSAETTSDGRLYFHNVRSYYYNIYQDERPPMVIYRLKRRVKNDSIPLLHFSIIQHPVEHQAFVWSELRNVPNLTEQSSLLVVHSHDTVAHALHNMNVRDNYQIAVAVYQALQSDTAQFYLSANGHRRPLLNTEKKRYAAQVTLEDYFKLIRKIKS